VKEDSIHGKCPGRRLDSNSGFWLCPVANELLLFKQRIAVWAAARGTGVNLGIRRTLADMGQTIAENFGGKIPHGKSFLGEIRT
jgi:hypothetical protein